MPLLQNSFKPPRSSITANEADRFNKHATERDRLWCTQPTGLYLLKLKNGCAWRLKYRDNSAKQRETTIGRYPDIPPKDAKQEATRLLNNRHTTDPLLEKQERRAKAIRENAQTMQAYMEGPYTAIQARKKNQGRHTINIIKSNFAGLLNRPMASLGKADIRRWQASREKSGISHSSLVRAFGALKTMLRRAELDEIIDCNPLRDVRLEAPSAAEATSNPTRRLLTEAEVLAFNRGVDNFNERKRSERRNSRTHGKSHLPNLDSAAFAHWFVPFAQAALHLGMRPGDLYALEWTHINFPFRRLTKIPEKTRHHPQPQQLDLPLNETILEILKAWHLQSGQPETGFVFPSKVTGGQLDRVAHNRHWKHVKELSGGLAADLHFYALRHHFISSLVSNGVPLLTVARLVGHKGTKMIENHYGHLCPAKAAEAMESFGISLTSKENTDARNVR